MSSMPVPGDLLGGRYRLGALLGRGGMASVHRATDEQLGRDVAVKLFRLDEADGEAERMASETRLLAALRHPSLVTVHDAATDGDGHPFLVMELIDGPSLGERIAAGPLPADEVRGIAVELAEALHVVHAARVVHRDVKPSNILLDPSPTGTGHRAKLADFGIARLADSTRLTLPGTVVGTAAYLSPEQARGQEPGAPADVYALGLVLLEALTGQRAYPQAALQDALIARLHGPPVIPGSLGYGWKSLLTAMTVDDPTGRPAALEVADRVRALSDAPQAATGATAPPPSSADDVPATGVLAATGALDPAGSLPATAAMSTASTAPLPRTAVLSTAPRRKRWLLPAALALVVLLGGGGLLAWSIAQQSGAEEPPAIEAVPSSPAPAPSETVAPAVDADPSPEATEVAPAEPETGGPGNSDAGHANGNGPDKEPKPPKEPKKPKDG